VRARFRALAAHLFPARLLPLPGSPQSPAGLAREFSNTNLNVSFDSDGLQISTRKAPHPARLCIRIANRARNSRVRYAAP